MVLSYRFSTPQSISHMMMYMMVRHAVLFFTNKSLLFWFLWITLQILLITTERCMIYILYEYFKEIDKCLSAFDYHVNKINF